jgi:hypothetical protein
VPAANILEGGGKLPVEDLQKLEEVLAKAVESCVGIEEHIIKQANELKKVKDLIEEVRRLIVGLEP